MSTRPEPARTGRRGALVPVVGLALVLLAGCRPPEEILPGERFGVRETEEAAAAAEAMTPEAVAAMLAVPPPQPPARVPQRGYALRGEAAALSLPAQRVNADWTHVGGDRTHSLGNPALGPTLTRVWSAPIGQGNTRRLRLSADPVVADGRVVTMDTLSDVRAHSTSGSLLWSRNLTPPTETAGEATGGGLAIGGRRLFVTTGWGELHALDLATGAVLWTQRLDANPATAPTVDGDIVYVVSRDSRGWAVDVETGRVLWQIEGADPSAGTVSGAAPAIAGDTVIFGYSSGEVIAALKRGGVRLWSTSVTGQRRGRAYAAFGDIASDPVVVGRTIYAGNPSGRLAAIDAASGARIWTAVEGPSSPVWPAGGAVFLVSDENELIRLNASDGSAVWAATLPLFTEERVRRRQGVFAHYGPVLAGGRLIVASTDARLRQVDPVSGRLLAELPLSAGAAANPVVAGRTLYIVTADGQLHAFR